MAQRTIRIASGRGTCTRTVETHISNAMAKLQGRTRVESISLAVQRGVLSGRAGLGTDVEVIVVVKGHSKHALARKGDPRKLDER
jgi:hypothetical protein